MHTRDFLLEIGTEELPAKSLKATAATLAENIQQGLAKAELAHGKIQFYATPRRLAILIKDLNTKQPDQQHERKGPTLRAAFDAKGKPTPALEGFVRSYNTSIGNLEKLETPQGTWLIYRYNEHGKKTTILLPEIISKALIELPIIKPMQWSDLNVKFIRPVHWIVMLFGTETIHTKILGLPTDRISYGHRFHHPQKLELIEAALYAQTLKKTGHVIVDFNERQQVIREQVKATAKNKGGQALINDTLLEEVTGLVEWPVILIGAFDKKFLKIPREALIAAMEDHQKCFPIEDQNHNLLPYFITVSNVVSNDPPEVKRGNERVMRARLADAKFFYETDCKRKLEERLENLKHVIFQSKLGSLYDKSQRISNLASHIAAFIDNQKTIGERAGLLCKADLVTEMVGEFPELQGIMGGYYARHDGEKNAVATAIQEHYLPRFAGDALPSSQTGCAVALADRLDTLVGIFGIDQIPTGEKDPFALRRAALAILRILIERNLDLNLYELLNIANQNYQKVLPNIDVTHQVHEFILERLRTWYQDQGISPDTLAAVLAAERSDHYPLDIHRRVSAIQAFRQLPEATSLSAANKRIGNLLIKTGQTERLRMEVKNPSSLYETLLNSINPGLFTHQAENILYNAIKSIRAHAALETYTQSHLTQTPEQKLYTDFLTTLANLQTPVDRFLDEVLVMHEDEQLRNNRLALLAALRQLFLTVADISLLQG